jgi:hypothetical protein
MTPSAASHASSAASYSAQREREREVTATAERSREEEEEAVADGERHSELLSIKYDSTNRFLLFISYYRFVNILERRATVAAIIRTK